MSTPNQWQLSHKAAELYEEIAVSHILGPFASALVEWAAPPLGATVIDVGCGTGAATRVAATHVGPQGRVIGIDINAGMIAKAKSLSANQSPVIEFHEQSAYQLPAPDHSIDMVISTQVMQFLQDKPRAFDEMKRTLRIGGSLAFSAWCMLEEIPYFHAQAEALTNLVGPEAGTGIRTAASLADPEAIHRLLDDAGFSDINITVTQLDLTLPALHDFIPRHISATPFAAGFSASPPDTQQALIDEMLKWLEPYIDQNDPTQSAKLPFRSYLVRATNH